MTTFKHIAAVTLLVAASIGVTGCSDDPMAPPEAAEVNGYLRALPTWDEFAPARVSENEPVGDPTPPDVSTVGDTEYSCVSTPYSITSTPDRLAIFNPDSEILWLGGLLQGVGHRDGLGSLAELPIRQRAPLTVFIDLLTENNTRTVANPNAATVSQAIGELVEEAEANGHQAGSNIFFDLKKTHSVEQASLELGVSARYLGTSVEAELSYEESTETNTLTAYFVQQMYTSSVVLPQTPTAFFSGDFTQEQLQEQIDLGRVGPNNLPTYISNIVWGRMLMVTMTSTHSYQAMEAALRATNDAIGSGSISGSHASVLQTSSIKISTVGGNDQGVEDMIKTGRLGEYFDAELSLTQARPLSYTVRNLADNVIATVSETTEYNLKECTSAPATPTGAVYKLSLDKIKVEWVDGVDPWPGISPELYYSFSLTTGDGTSLIVSLDKGDYVTKAEGEFLTLPNNSNEVALYTDRRTGSMKITGTVWDYDPTSAHDTLGSWNLTYNHEISNGQRSSVRDNGYCGVRLYWTITKVRNLYD